MIEVPRHIQRHLWTPIHLFHLKNARDLEKRVERLEAVLRADNERLVRALAEQAEKSGD